MVLLEVIVLLGFIVLGVLSRREEGGMLERMAVYLYKKGCIYKLPFLNARSVQKDLESLHPGQSGLLLQGDYYRQKIRLLLLVLGVGTLLGVLAGVRASSGGALTAQGELLRPELGQGEREVELQAGLEGEKLGRLTVSVSERQLTLQETQELYQEFWEKLKQEALGDNLSWQQVSTPLALVEELEGYPFSVSWRSSDYERIGSGGRVHAAEQPQTVSLTAEIRYLDYVWTEELTPLVVPVHLEGTELLLEQIREAYRLAAEEAASTDRISLPSSMDGRPLSWEEIREDYSMVLMLMTVCTSVAIFLFRDRDLHRQVLLRRERMRETYPVVVSKFTLYLGAGMTIRGAFRKIALDYSNRQDGEKEQPLYEEMLYACNQLQAGISESRTYEMWAARTGLQDCARLSAMLAQNLKKGERRTVVPSEGGGGQGIAGRAEPAQEKGGGGRHQAVNSHDYDDGHCDGAGYDSGISELWIIKQTQIQAVSQVCPVTGRKEENMKTWNRVRDWMDRRFIEWKYFMTAENTGMGTVEIILIIVVLVGIVIIFKSQITDLVESIFSKITKQVNKV